MAEQAAHCRIWLLFRSGPAPPALRALRLRRPRAQPGRRQTEDDHDETVDDQRTDGHALSRQRSQAAGGTSRAPDGVAAAIEHARPLMRHRRPANPAATRRCHHPATPEASTPMLAALVTSALTPPHP